MKYKLESVHLGTRITVENLADYYPVIFKYEPKTTPDGISITLPSVAKLMAFANDVDHPIILYPRSNVLQIYDDYLE